MKMWREGGHEWAWQLVEVVGEIWLRGRGLGVEGENQNKGHGWKQKLKSGSESLPPSAHWFWKTIGRLLSAAEIHENTEIKSK